MPKPVRSRTPMMLIAALALALPLILTAGIGIYRAEHQAPSRLVPPSPEQDDARASEPRDRAAR